jgi:sucrose phosphatase-like protein
VPQTALFISDLDGTLAGDQPALNQFKEFLSRFSRQPELIYVTGRHVQSARELIDHDGLPWPDVLITDIGTAIYRGPELTQDAQWQQRMRYQWCPGAILEIAERIDGLTVQDLPDTQRVSFLTEHPESVTALEQRLRDAELPHKLIYSADVYVDVLPQCAGKGNAVSYVLKGDASRNNNILVAGDTGNDAEMLALGYPAVVVGNGHHELRALSELPTIYWARQTYAAGIQEGWEHHYGSPT